MTNDEFRRYGYAVIDWIAKYLENVERYPVMSQVQPGDIRAQLPDRPPDDPEPFDQLLADVERVILPGITHWQSPNFFAYFPASSSGPSVLGDLLSSGLGIQGMLWLTSPACTELETHVLDWVAEMLGLPGKFKSDSAGGGVIQDSASSASLCALLAARERATGYETRRGGLAKHLVAYASEHAHSSIEKGMNIAGLGTDNLRKIPSDERFALRPDALQAAIEADLATGRTPCFVSAAVGTTSCGSIDPLVEIGEICRRFGLWMHVDAAMAGTAAICPEFRDIHRGLEAADSYCFNPHKWMFTNFDCDCFFVADRKALIQTLSILPEYLRNQATEAGSVIDYRDWQIPLGRRFRSLKLWFVIRSFGVRGIQERIRRHVAIAQQFAAWVVADPDFELAAPEALSLVCFRHRGGDAINQQIMDRLNQSGQLYLTHTRLCDKLTLRLAIGQTNTELRHVERAWQLIREASGSVA
ncbi:MAG: aspartate aminotransferase family protein [Candidatus Anammoximicrobium sp.]|nr:aspartate aminotransferase family protein [Candidatus Anammoximicrobium sp.]